MASVAVTDAELRHALGIIRSVGKGDEVTAFGRARFSTGFFSRFTRHKKMFKDYSELELDKFDVAFLVTDGANEFGVKKHLKNALLPGKRNWERFRDKGDTFKLAKKLGIPMPKTWIMRSYSDDWDYPIRVKPAKSSGSRGSRKISDRWEMKQVGHELLEKYGKIIVQEEVEKRATVGVELLYNKGKPRAVFQHKRIREYPVNGGPSTMRVSVNYRKTRELAEKLMTKTKWHGIAMVEFGITKKGPVLFEVNPRWWGSLALAIRSGVDFPRLYRDIVLKGDTEPVTKYRTGVVCKYFLFGDILHFSKQGGILRFIRSLGETSNFDIMSLRDPLPGLSRLPLAIEMSTNQELKERYLIR
ncbi:ATP-grasp domain-containing protein [Candidatus Bathyarchaeota archaeon]|nr:ATP-grasp domain-containing protein [Candidatus Bathyarchaeota archaeon]